MRTIGNRIYGVKLAGAWTLWHTAQDDATLPAGEACEVAPVYKGSDGFMLGPGESVDGRRYVFRAGYGRGGGNARRTLIAWKGAAFSDGVWHVRPGTVIAFNHYVAGRRLLNPEVLRTEVAAWRGGAAALEVEVGGKWVELYRLAAKGVAPRRALPAACAASWCPTFRLRGLAGCDLDWLGYDFAAEVTGPDAHAVGATDVRELGTGRTLAVLT